MARGKRVQVAPGVYRDAFGFAIVVRVGSSRSSRRQVSEKRFPPETDLAELKSHVLRERMRLADAYKKAGGGPVVRGTLAADVETYLRAARLSTQRKAEREAQLAWWCETFGHRSRGSLQATELRVKLNSLLRCSESTVNKYRTALSNLFTVLGGKNGPNPLRDVPRLKEPEAGPRDQPYELIQLVLWHIRDRGQGQAPSRTKAFLRVLSYCPVTKPQLAKMTAANVFWDAGEVWVPGRAKGAGTEGRRKPLSPQAIEALRAFDAAGCWGRKPANSSIGRTFRRALRCAIAELQQTRPDLDLSRAGKMTPKDLRHSFAALVFRVTGSLSVTGQMLDHRDAKTTLRYAKGAVDTLLREAGEKVTGVLAAVEPHVPAPEPVPEPVAPAEPLPFAVRSGRQS